MKQKTFVASVIYFCYVALMFMPGYFQNRLFGLAENGMFLVGVGLLVYYMYKPSRVAKLISAYYLFVVAMTIIYQQTAIDIHLFISNAKIVLVILMTDFMLRREKKAALDVLLAVFLLFVVSDFLSVVFYPNGLYKTEIIWNEWTTTIESQWILGNKNNRYVHYLFLLLISYFKYAERGRKNGVMGAFICIISVTVALMVEASTGTVVMVVAVIATLLYTAGRKMPFSLQLRYVYAAYLVSFALVMFSQSPALNNLMMNLFEKDASFSNRRDAWAVSWDLISKRPLCGIGFISSGSAQGLLGSKTFVNAHNGVLQVLLNGGLVGLGLVAACFAAVSKKIKSMQKKNERAFMVIMLTAFLIQTLLESIFSTPISWMFLLVLYYADSYMKPRTEELSVLSPDSTQENLLVS